MEWVANNLVSETSVLEGVALEDLNAFLDLQVKLIFEALDERIAARNTKRDALCVQSSARPSGGSGVIDAAVAQEVTLDLNLAAAATSTTHAEPSDINVGAPSSCSTKFQNRSIDPYPYHYSCRGMQPPAGSAPPKFDDPTPADFATFASHEFIESAFEPAPRIIDDNTRLLLLEEMRQMELRLGRKLDVQYQIPSAAATSATGIFNDVNFDKEPVFHEGPIFDEEPSIFDEGPVFDEEHVVDVVPSSTSVNTDLPSPCSVNCPSVFISITAPATVYAIAEEVMVDLFQAPSCDIATACIGIILSDGPDIIVDACLPAYWMDVPMMLKTSCEAVLCPTHYREDKEQCSCPTLSACLRTGDIAQLRPIPWPSFITSIDCSLSWNVYWVWKPPWPLQQSLGVFKLKSEFLLKSESRGGLLTTKVDPELKQLWEPNCEYACLSQMGILGFLNIEPEQQHSPSSGVLKTVLTAEFSDVIFVNHIVDHCAAIFVLTDICTGAPIHELLAWPRCEIIEEPVQRKCGGYCRLFLLDVCQLNTIGEDSDHQVLTSIRLHCSVSLRWGNTISQQWLICDNNRLKPWDPGIAIEMSVTGCERN